MKTLDNPVAFYDNWTEVEKVGKALGRPKPDAETVGQALACRIALARRPGWNHEIAATVVEVCGSAGYNWFDLET